MIDFVPIWTAILGGAVFLYVLLDGFDLGVGILHGFAKDTAARRTLIMQSIAPVWDGNETWLVLGGLGLLAAFPLAFAIILPAVYFPILLMLLALIFRGVAFEFRYSDAERRSIWDWGFTAGSGVATFAQGIVLGAFIQGFKVEGRHFAGSSLDCFTPFSVLTGAALVCGYALLGAGWLIWKTEGEVQAMARRLGRRFFLATLAAVAVVSVWTPLMDHDIAARWFSWPNILLAVAGAADHRDHRGHRMARTFDPVPKQRPFLAAIALFAMSYLGIAISSADDRAASFHTVAGGFPARDPNLHRRRCTLPVASHSYVYGVVLLGVSGQSARRSSLSAVKLASRHGNSRANALYPLLNPQSAYRDLGYRKHLLGEGLPVKIALSSPWAAAALSALTLALGIGVADGAGFCRVAAFGKTTSSQPAKAIS